MATISKATGGCVVISTANSNRDGSGSISTVLTADGTGFGVIIKQFNIKAINSVSIGMIRIFVIDNLGNKVLLLEVPVFDSVADSNTPTFSQFIPMGDLFLPPNWSLGVSTENSEAFNVTCFGINIESY